jgi:hypothetical protein
MWTQLNNFSRPVTITSATAALEMVLVALPGIHRFKVQLSNITNKHLKHVGKGNLIRPVTKLYTSLENEKPR